MTDLTTLPVYKLSELITHKKLSPIELIDSFLARIEKYDPHLRAFTEVYADEARVAARGAEAAIYAGYALGPLHGIPIALKDLVMLQGRIVSGGSQMWSQRRADKTADVAQRLLRNGIIFLGKTHTVEFAMGGWGTNSGLGTPWNPWDLTHARTPGGSSSGSGVAIAADMTPWALGTDTGGSVRLPASWCGIAGLKTSHGRISNHGILPLSPTLDTPGPMARHVEDIALLYAAMQGPDRNDPRTNGLPYTDPFIALKHGVKGMRLARMPESERAYASEDVLTAYDRSLQELEHLGAEIVSIQLPFKLEDIADYNLKIMAAESYALYHELIDDEETPLDPHVRPRIAAGKGISAKEYIHCLQQRRSMKQQFEEAMEGIDALLTPTTMTTALPLEEVDQTTAPAHYTRFSNFLDLCALSLPNGMSSNSLPTSLQIVCRSYDEAKTMQIGWALQSITNWHHERPSL